MPQVFTNRARSALQAAILATDTSITISAADQARFPIATTNTSPINTAGQDWFKVVLSDATNNFEIVYVRTRASGSAVLSNILRAQEGTTALAFPVGSVAAHTATALDSANDVTISQAQANTYTAFTTAGTATAYTLTPAPAITAYADGQIFYPSFHLDNGANATININALGARALVSENYLGVLSPVPAGAIKAGNRFAVIITATQAKVLGLSAGLSPFLQNYITGLSASVVSATSVSLTTGQSTDSTNTVLMALLAATSKTNLAWAVGNAVGGLDTGTLAANQAYFIYKIRRPDTGVVDWIYSLNANSPALPTNYTQFRRLSDVILTNAAAQFDRIVSLLSYDGQTRQTVLNGAVDANGLPNFGGATGAATVTASTVLLVSAANGFGANADRIGVIGNPSWTGLSTNGVMQLFLDVNANGSCTPVSSALLTTYQRGGAYSNTTGQNVFNTTDMQMRVGTGAANNQVWRVPVGEVTVAGGLVTAIRWYALRGRYVSPLSASLPGASVQVSFNHNLGTDIYKQRIELQCLTPELSYSVGDKVDDPFLLSASTASPINMTRGNVSGSFATPATANPFALIPKGGGNYTFVTNTNWGYRVILERDF